jgi:hypothetical protein
MNKKRTKIKKNKVARKEAETRNFQQKACGV